MSKIKKICSVCLAGMLVILFACSSATDSNDDKSDPQLPLDPFEQNLLLAKTVNLGNALEAPAEGDWGITLEEDFFRAISEAGFTAVRIPCRWSAYVSGNAPYTIDPNFMIRVQWALNMAEKYDLAAVINIHHFEEIFENPNGEKNKFLAIWRQIAEKLKTSSPDVFYEILNEPHDNLTADLWNIFLEDAIDAVRAIDSVHTVIIGTAEWGGISAMNKLSLPENETNLIFTFHYYNPFEFTHQGADWVDNSEQWLGRQWLATTSELNAIGTEFNAVKQWAESNNVPVFLGEFGAFSQADMDSRVRWTNAVARIAESNNFSWAYWEFASGFGIYDLESHSWRESLLDVLVN